MELTPRLQLLADWVPQDTRLADVGTDHAYLPVWLRLQGRVPYAIASDLRNGPLERAKETGRIYGVDNIDYRLCNGLVGIGADEVDTIAIAGMGGETIASILSAAPWTCSTRYTLLLQPMTHAELLRRFLMENGYCILREALVYDRGTIYPVIKASAGSMQLSAGQIYGGSDLLRDPLGNQYLIERIIRLHIAIAGLNRSTKPEDIVKADTLRDTITALLELREEWRHANCQRN